MLDSPTAFSLMALRHGYGTNIVLPAAHCHNHTEADVFPVSRSSHVL